MEDRQIIDLYWQRNQQAVAETSLKYSTYVRRIAYNILTNHADAEECENDTYVAAWNAIPPTRPERLSAFLGRIVRNIALDLLDYNKAAKRNGEFNLIVSELSELIASNEDVEASFAEGELAALISRFLRGTDGDTRIVFVRRYWHSNSIRDIAKQMHMSESKVKSMLFRTRNKLRLYLQQEGVVL